MAVDYVQKIQAIQSLQLTSMLADLKVGKPINGWPKGKAFEHIVLRGFELESQSGAEVVEVVWPFDVRIDGMIMEQIDGAIYHDGLACLVESKDYGGAINVEPITKLRSQLLRRPEGTLGLVFARTGYTEPAKTLTRMTTPLTILLWEFEELAECLTNKSLCRALRTKYKYAVERGLPDYNVKGGLR